MNLRDKAKKLGIDFDEDITDDELKKLVEAKEREIEDEQKKKLEDVEYLKKELKEAIEKRDAAKGDKRKLQAKVDELEAALKDSPTKDDFISLKKELEDLRKFKLQIDEEAEKQRLEKMSTEERDKVKKDKEKAEFDAKMQQLQEIIDNEKAEKEKIKQEAEIKVRSLRQVTLENEILKSAKKYNALRPDQIVKLVKDEFEFDDGEEKFVKNIKENGKLKDIISVDDFIKDFLGKEENDNLVEAKVAKSMNLDKTKSGNSDGDGGSKKYDPKDPAIIRKAMYENYTPEEYIKNVLEVKDTILAKKREKQTQTT